MRLAINGFQRPAEKSEERQKKLDWQFVDAVGAKDWKKAAELLGCGADPNARNAWGFPALITIASCGPQSLLECAMAKDADRDIKSPVNDWRPLLAAAMADNRGNMETLLLGNADIKAKAADGKSAEDVMMERGHADLLDIPKTNKF